MTMKQPAQRMVIQVIPIVLPAALYWKKVK